MPLRALVWDVDGTVAETEADGHRVAFNEAFAAAGLPWRWSVECYGELLAVSGGRERMLADFATRPDAPPLGPARDALVAALHLDKNRRYAARVAAGAVAARPGVLRLMHEALHAGIALAIATTTSRSNVEALFTTLMGADWREHFASVVCAEDAPLKKPDPQAYQRVMSELGLAPEALLAVEDSPNGLAAARAAGIATLVTPSVYFRDGDFTGAAAVCAEGLDGPPAVDVAALRALAGRAYFSDSIRST